MKFQTRRCAAVTVLVVPVSFLADWDQQERMSQGFDVVHTDAGWDTSACDFATLTDEFRESQVQGGVGGNQGVQVDHGTALLPEERADLARHTTYSGRAN